MAYGKINWTNTRATPLNAQNLNKMDNCIYDTDKSLNSAYHLMTYPNVSADCLDGNFSVTGDTDLITEDGCLTIDSDTNTIDLTSDLSEVKTVDNNRLMLIKLRIKRNNSAYLYVAFKYITADDEVYIINENIVASNLRISNATPSYLIEDDNYHNIWCIFKSANAIQIKGIAVELANTVKTTVSNLQAFYSIDKVEGGTIGEQLVSPVYSVQAESQSEELTVASVT